MVGCDNDSESDTPSPPLVLVDAEGNEYDPKGKSYKYRDFSHVNEDDEEPLPDGPSPPPARNCMETSIRVQKFPVKLYAILAQKEFHDIITWMPHGRSWKVLKPNIFETMVMPLFFEYSNYHSFNRLVNAWSFRRVSSGPDRGSYYHELFLRGKPHLQKYMRRLPKTHKKLPMQKKDEPDFYRLGQANPLPALEDAPVPGGLLASSAINGAVGLYDQHGKLEPPTVVSPADSSNSLSGMQQLHAPTSAPLPQRNQMPSYGAGQMGTGIVHGNNFQEDSGDMYVPAQDQQAFVTLPQHQNSYPREVQSQITRGVHHTSSGTFRSMGLQQERLRSNNVSMMETNGMSLGGMLNGASIEQDMTSFMHQQPQMGSLRPGTMHINNHSAQHMNNHINKLSSFDRMGQLGSMSHMDVRAVPLAQMQQQMNAPMRNQTAVGVFNCNGYNDYSGQQQLSQHRQMQMNLYQRDAVSYGSDNINSLGMVGGMSTSFPGDFGTSTMSIGSTGNSVHRMAGFPRPFAGSHQ